MCYQNPRKCKCIFRRENLEKTFQTKLTSIFSFIRSFPLVEFHSIIKVHCLSQPKMTYNFSGKVVIVTGSSSGIGEDAVINFAKSGAKVVVCGRNESRVSLVAEKCKKVSPNGLNHWKSWPMYQRKTIA